jgi:hypothetical protein
MSGIPSAIHNEESYNHASTEGEEEESKKVFGSEQFLPSVSTDFSLTLFYYCPTSGIKESLLLLFIAMMMMM